MLPLEHSAILWTFIKLPFSIKTFILSLFKWSLKTGFTVVKLMLHAKFQFSYYCGLCRFADWFEPYLAEKPKDRFSLDQAHMNNNIQENSSVEPDLSHQNKIIDYCDLYFMIH